MVWYCTRESVKSALDEQETARSNAQIDDAIEQGARSVEGLCHRPENGLAPMLATRYFDYPSRTGRPPSWRVWFNEFLLITASGVTVGGGATSLTASQYFLKPDSGPPYNRLEIDLGGSGALSSGDSWQNAIGIAGLWGWTNARESVGTLSSQLGATSSSTAALAWTTARFGVGDVLFMDSEAITIRDRNFVDSTQNLGASLTASGADVAVSISDGTAFAVEEIIQIGTESMRVVSISGNTLTVKRAWDGSQLAAHTLGDDVYALTGVELTRARLGTTIAVHATSTVVYRWVPPGPLATLNRAYAINTLLGERSGWARSLQANADTAVELTGRGIAKLERDVERIYGRKVRTRAIV